MRLDFLDVFVLQNNVLVICRECLFTVVLGNHLERIDDDETVPDKGVDLSFRKATLELFEHLRGIYDVQIDQISLE